MKKFFILLAIFFCLTASAAADTLENYTKISFENSDMVVDGKTLTMYIRGEIDEKTASKVLTFLHIADLRKVKEVTFEINSPGGDVSCCLEIITRMDEWKKRGNIINTRAYGVTASSACYIFACGTKGKRLISKWALLMNHQLRVTLHYKESTPETAAETLKSLALQHDLMMNILSEATGKAAEELKSMFNGNKELWMTPDEAITLGFADAFIP